MAVGKSITESMNRKPPRPKRHEIRPGARIGRLRIRRLVKAGGGVASEAICDCGVEVRIPISYLMLGVQSCGCLFRDREEMNKRIQAGQPPQGKWGGKAVRYPAEYGIWTKMIARCTNPQSSGYANYGGRGIGVCLRWRRSFTLFLQDMGPRPDSSSTIERIDNNGDYSPENCCWATRADQARNTRRNHRVYYNGENMILKDAVRLAGLSYCAVQGRIKRGWKVADALAIPVGTYCAGRSYQRTHHAKPTGVHG